MAYLFSSGLLQNPAVQLSTFRRLLKGEPDELFCYEQEWLTLANPPSGETTDQTRYAVVRFTGRADTLVQGTVFEVSEAELVVADGAEPTEYGRIIVTLASGKEAWVFADARAAEPRRYERVPPEGILIIALATRSDGAVLYAIDPGVSGLVRPPAILTR
jgi:hypothetical protein